MLKKELIIRCQQGDRQAMGMLYTAMHDELLALCLHYAGDVSTAEDLLHDAFLLIFSRIAELQHPERARAWMRTVTKNVALLYLQQRQQQSSVSLDSTGAALAATAVAAPSVPVTYDELMNLVDALPSGYRQVFRLSVLEGLSHQQIAALLNIEPHSSSSQLYRAKSLLRQSLRLMLLGLLALLVPTVGYLFFHRQAQPVPSDQPLTAQSEQQQNVGPAPADSVVPSAPSVPSPTPLPPSPRRQAPHQEVAQAVAAEPDSLPSAPATPTDPTNPTSPIQPTPPTYLAEDDFYPGLRPEHRPAPADWTLDVAYNGLGRADGLTPLPQGMEGANTIDSTSHHRLPLVLSVSLSHALSQRLSLQASLRYTLLSSELQTGNSAIYSDTEQRLRYLGLGLGLNYRLWHHDRWRLYGHGEAALDLPLRSTAETTYIGEGHIIDQEQRRLHPHAQWSLGLGLGLHYELTPMLGFFLEPSLHYYFDAHDGLGSWRTEHRLCPELPLGIRITF
ncbi:MAG: sigma-70 family RNA polymerase sigma factor [Prevotella sp.]|nr:sigma-70 family RNA polymerase sigma factor [Prevotella sp.]